MRREVSAYPVLRARLRAKYGDRVWLGKSDMPGLPHDAQPWAIWSRSVDDHIPYRVLDCLDPNGHYVEPGGWIDSQLDWLRYETQWGTKQGAYLRIADHQRDMLDRRKAFQMRRREEAMERAMDRAETLCRPSVLMNPELPQTPRDWRKPSAPS